MPSRRPLPAALGQAFSVSDARDAGVGYGRTRGGDLESPFHGVRAKRGMLDAPSPEARATALARAYAPRLGPAQFFCDVTALALWGLPVSTPGPVHVGTPSPARSPRARGVVGHEVQHPQIRIAQGMPVLDPLRSWAQAASHLALRELVVLGDAMVRRRSPLVTLAELAEFVASRRGSRNFRRLDAASGRVRARTDSPKETELRLVIVDAGLPEPAVNARVGDEEGRFVALVDLYFEEYRVGVEYDGGYHFASDRQIHDDIDRLARLAEAGVVIIRVDKFHLAAPRTILARIRAALLAQGWREPSETARKPGRSSNQ